MMKNVVKYTALLDTGISAERIANRGYGQTFPVASNATAAGRQLNRRVEIIVSGDGEGIAPR
jgi:outer membrane protein OmpA-like peptidoglycan-associated protein